MGPIEAELRQAADECKGPVWYLRSCSESALPVVSRAILEVTPDGCERWTPYWEKIMARAIEAAKVLGI